MIHFCCSSVHIFEAASLKQAFTKNATLALLSKTCLLISRANFYELNRNFLSGADNSCLEFAAGSL
jgi:hypothetical protein